MLVLFIALMGININKYARVVVCPTRHHGMFDEVYTTSMAAWAILCTTYSRLGNQAGIR